MCGLFVVHQITALKTKWTPNMVRIAERRVGGKSVTLPPTHIANSALLCVIGAVDEIRTRNILLGRQILYQLNYYCIWSG